MATNDDSASRRGRRPEPDAQQWRAQNGNSRDDRRPQGPVDSGNSRFNNGRPDNVASRPDPQRNSYSNFSRHSYEPPRQEPPLPPPPSKRAPEPAPYQPNTDANRGFGDMNFQRYAAPSSAPLDADPPRPLYSDQDDLYGRDPRPNQYDQPVFGGQNGAVRHEGYDHPYDRQSNSSFPTQMPPINDEGSYFQSSPQDEYDRNFSARIASQESQASRFFLPDEPAPRAPQPQPQQFGFGAEPAQAPAAYGHDPYNARNEQHQGWNSGHEEHSDYRGGVPQRVSQGDEFDEDFFADEDELDHEDEHVAPKKRRTRLIGAALVSAIAVGGGGAYFFKSVNHGGSINSSIPTIPADSKPSKDVPSHPGGRQFANGEKAIYDRLTPNGVQAAPVGFVPQAQASTAPGGGNSLEDRIEEALRRSQKSGDAPPGAQPAPSGRPGLDQPNVVRSEIYRPDGTRVEAARPTVTPNLSNNGQLPYPFGNAPAAPVNAGPTLTPAAGGPAPFRTNATAPAPAQASLMAAPAPKSAMQAPPAEAAPSPVRTASINAAPVKPAGGEGSYYVQLASATDEAAAEKKRQELAGKYASILGDAQFNTKAVDNGDKGVAIKLRAGPFGSKQEAADLCAKLKGAGLQANGCFVPKAE